MDPFGVLAFLHWDHPWNGHHFPPALLAKAVPQLKELGVSFVRTDILWGDVTRGFQKYDFSRYDPIIALLRRHGIEVLALLHYNKVDEGPEGTSWNRPPDSADEFAHYVAATVGHFKNEIRHWEIWNEPNHPNYWSAPRDNLKTYIDLLKRSTAAAKKADPSCAVLNGGLTEPVLEDVENLYANGGKAAFDILNIHTFIDPLAPDREERFDAIIRGVRKIMVDHGDANRKIWITEMGCPGVPTGMTPQTWFAGKSVNENQQAEWLETQYRMIRKYPFIEKLFWAFYRDTKIFKDATDHLGLVRFDLTPKPAFWRMKKLIQSADGSQTDAFAS